MRPPKHLSSIARKLWRDTCAAHTVIDPNQFALLRAACESFDRANEAREILAREGLTIRDRFQQLKAHPAASIERDARASMIQAFRALGFSPPPPE